MEKSITTIEKFRWQRIFTNSAPTSILILWPSATRELSYKNGHLQYADYSPLPHNLNLKFSATPDRLEVQPAVLQIGSSDVTLRAQLSNYANPVADGDYEIRIHTQDFAALSPSVKPAGDVSLTGKLRYQPSGNQPLLRALSIDGQIASDALIAVATGRRIDVKNLQGTYRLANGSLDTNQCELGILWRKAHCCRENAAPGWDAGNECASHTEWNFA